MDRRIGMSDTSPFSAPLASALTAAGVAFEDDGGQLKVPAAHAEVGDLLVTCDDGEITVFVGNFTHRHFTPHDGSTAYAAGTIEDCVRDAVEYVSGILNDQWILWAYPGGAGGSYRIGAEGDPAQDAPPADDEVVRYVWSGPYDARRDKSPERTRVQ
jgi:hypothetical protein